MGLIYFLICLNGIEFGSSWGARMVLSLRKLELLLKKEEAGNTCLLVARTVNMGFGKTLLLKESDFFVSVVGG